MADKISGVYKIINTITGDFYIGSSVDIKSRWAHHKCISSWKQLSNSQMYKDMQKYGLENFVFQVLSKVEPEYLKEVEQGYINMLKPTYNSYMAKGWNIEGYKEYNKEYKKTKKYKEYQKEYGHTEKGKSARRKSCNKYKSQLCLYEGKEITLNALASRFRKQNVAHAWLEAKKYLINK